MLRAVLLGTARGCFISDRMRDLCSHFLREQYAVRAPLPPPPPSSPPLHACLLGRVRKTNDVGLCVSVASDNSFVRPRFLCRPRRSLYSSSLVLVLIFVGPHFCSSFFFCRPHLLFVLVLFILPFFRPRFWLVLICCSSSFRF